ncbi:MAG: periplasmic heavy metal sensor [Pyrinomonadaceae bacterium]
MPKIKLLFTILVLLCCFGIVAAQENQPDDNPPPNEQRRPNLLRELGLSQEQVSQIREINQSNRQNIRAAQQKVGDARIKLDQAIYAEKVDESSVQIRLREFQDAQAEIAKIRAVTEFAIRKVLTADQLLRFRELRQRFEQFKRGRQENSNPMRLRNQRRTNRLKQNSNP